MSGVSEYATTAVAVMHCNAHGCTNRFESDEYIPDRWGDRVRQCVPAFDAGWKVYVGAREQRSYCPDHGPKVAMVELYPAQINKL